ncbi:MAG: ribonuclease R, partial [Calditrichaeota bacterium]|nr:ribonuclease R [Calditrichota bacterium]
MILKKIQGLLASNPNRTFKPKEMARKLGVSKTDYTKFRDTLKRAARDGKIAKDRGNNFGAIKRLAMIEGQLHVKTQGYGFLIAEDGGPDVFISQKNMGTALHKDVVQVQLYAEGRGKNREGRVIKVVERARQNIVGIYRKTKQYGFVVPDDLKITRDIFIPPGENEKAESGQKVVAKIVSWTDERTNPEGKIVEVLGFPEDPGVDVM